MYRSSNLQQISTPQQKINKQKILNFPTFLPPVNFIKTVMVLWSYVKLYVHLWLLFTQKFGFSYQFAAAIFLLHKTDKSQQLCQCSKQVRFLVCWQSHMFQIQAGLLIAKLIVAAGDVMRKIRDCVVGVNAEVPQHVSASLIKSSVT